jgi:hypothetical protein
MLQQRYMRFYPVNAAVIGATLICWSFATRADPLPDTGQTAFGDAPVGHLQPRASELLLDSAAEKAVQKRESDFDSKEKKLDMELDKTLNLCRCGEERLKER